MAKRGIEPGWLAAIRDRLEDGEIFRLAAAGAEPFLRVQVRRADTRFGQYPLSERCDEPCAFEPLLDRPQRPASDPRRGCL